GCIVSYDPNLRLPLWPSTELARSEMLAAMPLVDVVKISDEEATFLTGETPAATARHLLAQGPSIVCLTFGAAGSELFFGTSSVRVPGFSVPVVDTTGAGDGFVAGLLVWLVERGSLSGAGEQDLIAAARFANAVGALTCTKKGAIPSLPMRAEAEELVRA